LESIYFKIIGVSLVLTVSCGSKAWSVDQSGGKLLPEAFSGNRHAFTISSSSIHSVGGEALALDYILYLIDIQSKKEACLTIVFNYSNKMVLEQLTETPSDTSGERALPPTRLLHLHLASVGVTIPQRDAAVVPSPSDYCKKPVRAGPAAA